MKFNFFFRTIENLKLRYARRSPQKYLQYLRSTGIQIGDPISFHGNVKTIRIDVTRPSLVTIGDYVSFNANFALLTHDWGTFVFKNYYHDFLPSSGKVIIGNNVVFGRDVTVLKGVTIGNNCIIGAGSIVTKDIPDNSVAVGVPAKVVSTLDDYYTKRQKLCIPEAQEYARSIQERFHRRPVPADFWEEFPLFVDRENIHNYPEIPIRKQLGKSYDAWLSKHKRNYTDFEAFMKEAGL